MILQGRFAEANEEFYAENTKTIDFTGVRTNSKTEHTQAMNDFLGTIAKVNEVTLLRTAIGEDFTFGEYIFSFDLKDGSKIYWHEICLSKWKDGLVVEEQYFKD
jgi:hypothetical protein